MEEDLLERDLKMEKQQGDDFLNEAIEVLNANFSTKGSSPGSDTFGDFDFDPSKMEQFFNRQDLERNAENMAVDTRNFVDSEDTSWDTILPCKASSFYSHSPETVPYSNFLDQRGVSMMPTESGICRDTNRLTYNFHRTKDVGNHSYVSSAAEKANHQSSCDWGGRFQTSSFVVPYGNYNQATISTTYSGPRQSERIFSGTEQSANYMSVSSRYAGLEHFHVPSLSSSLSGTKISNAGDLFPKRNKTPTAFCSSCMQNIAANGGNFQRHQEACRRRHGLYNEQQGIKTERQHFPNAVRESMNDHQTSKSYSSSRMEDKLGSGEEGTKMKQQEMNEENKVTKSKAVGNILENFKESDDRDMQVLLVLQELRHTLMQKIDARCIGILREAFVALAERSKGCTCDISTSSKVTLPGEQVAMAILFYASC